MGNSPSSPAASALEFLATVADSNPVPLQDQSWKTLFTFATPLARYDPAEVQAVIRPHTASLVYHNTQTLNCQRLLFLLCQQLAHISPDSASIATANAIHLIRTILKDLIEQLNAAQLYTFLEVPPAVLAGELGEELQTEFSSLQHGSLLSTLTHVLLTSLAPLPPTPTPGAYLFQTELCQLLLVMASTQLYTPQIPASASSIPPHIFLEAFMAETDAAGHTVEVLLQHFIAALPPPSGVGFYAPQEPRSAMYFVKAAASTVLWLPYTAFALLRRSGGQQAEQKADTSPIASTALSVLLALHFYPPADIQQENPFRKALKHLQDADDLTTDGAVDAAEGGHGAAVGAAAAVPYASLFEALGRSLLNQESSVLLLYALLHGTLHFNNYCMARSDVDALLLPILELLYTSRGRSANQLYMLLIVLLILSQDSAFASNIHRIPLRNVPFYKDRPLVDTTLGSLLIVLLLRTAHYNLAALKDVYLHTNTLATLANLAPSMTNLSAHTCQRLVHLLHLLHRRHLKLTAKEAASSGDGEQDAETAKLIGNTVSEQELHERRALELQLYSDFIRIVLEIVNAILVNGLAANPELVYALLHRREVFAPFETDPKYADLMENIVLVTDYFGRKVESVMEASGGDISADKILDTIKIASRGWRKDKLRTFPELRFTYEEEASPEDFFVPYVWSIVVSTLSIPWTLSAITAFVPMIPTALPESAALDGVAETPQTATGWTPQTAAAAEAAV